MRKCLLCLFLALALVFAASAPVRAETVRKIGVCVDRMSDAETRTLCDMLLTFFAGQETDEIKYELFFADANGTADQQKEQIGNLLKQKLDLILINFLDGGTVEATAEKLKAAGTPAVLFGRQMIVRDGNEYTADASVDALLDQIQGCYVGGDLRQASLMQGRILADRPSHGDIDQDGVIHYVIIRDSAPRAESRLRTDLSLRAVGNAGLEAVCLADRGGAEDQEQARIIFEKLIVEFGTQIEAVICTHDAIAAGVAQAIQEADQEADIAVNADICVLGMDGTEEALQLIRENKIAGTVRIDDAAQERVLQEAILKILNGEAVQKYYWAEYKIINSANVDDLDSQN
ncbi:MAG: substrate-binding domain-containing protein [Clostridia bacterium]|nr:substrate-binding domain-containing protein [Clostridia bacterium]MBR4538973.1 substrate-binding domain-containing protein [Clostridia bacterium]